MRLNRIMTERPNICYIFEKLSVQGCQIWHLHVSIPVNSAPAHSTRPHNAKNPLRYHFRNSWKLASQKLLPQAVKVMVGRSQGHVLGHRALLSLLGTPFFCHFSDWKSPKESERVMWGHFHEIVDESPWKKENFGTSGYPIFFSFVS